MTSSTPKLVASVTVFFLFPLVYLSPIKTSLDHVLFDTLAILNKPVEADPSLIIVGIDEQSFANLDAQWPWPRGVHAHLLQQIAAHDPKAVVFDLLFAEPSDSDEDAIFAESVRQSFPVIFAADRQLQSTPYGDLVTTVEPIDPLIEAGAISGLVGVQTDSDQVIRKFPAGEQALWIKTVQASGDFGDQIAEKKAKSGRENLILYTGPRGTIRTVSYYQALFADEFLPPYFFRNKIVLIGFTLLSSPDAQIKGDNHATPYTRFTNQFMPGVEVHANAISAMRNGGVITRFSSAFETSAAVLIVAGSSLIFALAGSAVGALCLLTICLLLLATSFASFSLMTIYVPVLTIILVICIAYGIFALSRYYKDRKDAAHIRVAFEHYVPKRIVQEMASNPAAVKLGGERKKITVLFTDLAGFTSLSERTEAEELSELLNDHLDRMTKIIASYEGTVDKFIGDAIMAFWGAPVMADDQATRAVRCACEMQEAMEVMREEYRAEGRPELFMRVGINTCEAIVGNMGGEDRFDYTAIGDGVNLAARLEGANKAYGTGILISGSTASELPSELLVCLIDRVRVKGKKEPAPVFTTVKETSTVTVCENLAAAMSACNWTVAADLTERLRSVPQMQHFSALMDQRIEENRHKRPGEWDGVTDLDKL